MDKLRGRIRFRSPVTYSAAQGGNTVYPSGVSAGTVAVGTANLGVSPNGVMRVGFSGGTAQIGFIVNGTCFVAEGTAGGAMTMRANPAGA